MSVPPALECESAGPGVCYLRNSLVNTRRLDISLHEDVGEIERSVMIGREKKIEAVRLDNKEMLFPCHRFDLDLQVAANPKTHQVALYVFCRQDPIFVSLCVA